MNFLIVFVPCIVAFSSIKIVLPDHSAVWKNVEDRGGTMSARLEPILCSRTDYPMGDITVLGLADLPNFDWLKNRYSETSVRTAVINSSLERTISVQVQPMRWTLMFGIGTLGVAFARLLLLPKNRRKEKNRAAIDALIVTGNDIFKEVVDLAKNNDPAFLGRFKEVYPVFCQDLCKRYPGILNSELTFCAYLKLNFTTKDIAAYTFVTPSAVRNRKNRMKKKFGIPANADIYAWVDNIASTQPA